MKPNGKRIKDLRKEEGLTQEQLAKKLIVDDKAISKKTLQRAENGEQMTQKTRDALSNFFKIDTDELITEEKNAANKKKPKVFFLRQIQKGSKLNDVLRINNLPIVHDYSSYIEGKEAMDLVVDFFEKCWMLHDACTGKHKIHGYKSSPNFSDIDLAISPLLAGLKHWNIGIFAKMFCTIRTSSLSLDDYEKILISGMGGHYYTDLTYNTQKKLGFFLFASNIKGDIQIPYDDPSKINNNEIKLPSEYIKERFKPHFYFDDIFADDDTNQPFQRPPKKYTSDNDAIAYGWITYMDAKKEENLDYFEEIWKDKYFKKLTDTLFTNYTYFNEEGEDEKGEMTWERGEIDIKNLDLRTIEEGKKQAAHFWNAWEIYNRRIPPRSNSWLKDVREEFDSNFPYIEHENWYGPKNTIITTYYRKVHDDHLPSIDIDIEISERYTYYEDLNGNTLQTTFSKYKDAHFYNGKEIHRAQETIEVYSKTPDFAEEVTEMLGKLILGKVKSYKDVKPEDRPAFFAADNMKRDETKEFIEATLEQTEDLVKIELIKETLYDKDKNEYFIYTDKSGRLEKLTEWEPIMIYIMDENGHRYDYHANKNGTDEDYEKMMDLISQPTNEDPDKLFMYLSGDEFRMTKAGKDE